MGRKSIAGQRRREIIKAFYQCVAREGFGKASVRKIAAEAGVLPSALHHYFKGRDEMVEELVVYFTDRIFSALAEKLAAIEAPGPRLAASIEFIYGPDMINPEYAGFFLECCAEARHNDKVRQTIAHLFSRFRTAIVGQLDENPAFGALLPEKKTLMATLIVAIHEGVELQWFADPSSIDLSEAAAATRDLIRLMTTELAGEKEV